VDAGPVELRILGSLIEKQRTTPDVYPLSLNSLRLACNQTTNRDPVVSYDEPTIRTALQELSTRKWVRLASGPGSRAAKYRHLLDDALGLDSPQLAVLAVLMLRGTQTPGELRQRTERLHRFQAPDGIDQTLSTLAQRGFVALQPRRPGQKEQRYVQLLGGGEDVSETPDCGRLDLEGRVARLEEEIVSLRRTLDELKSSIRAG